MINFKTQSKRIPNKEEGIFYRSIINENGKEVDKTYIIGYCEKYYIPKQLALYLIIDMKENRR